MSFASFEYLGLLAGAVIAAALLPWRTRLLVLLVLSYVFYGWIVPWYAFILLASSAVDFAAGLGIERAPSLRARRAWLAASLCVNLGLLGYFKYVDFFLELVAPALGRLSLAAPQLDVVLPAGISFYTFQSLSYTLDVYRGQTRATRDPMLFATYVAFFPQLVAGPIERAAALLPQLRRAAFRPAAVWDALALILAGLAKKLVLADRITLLALPCYLAPAAYQAPALLVAMLAMPVALYLDFSAYTDIARGSARLFGVELSRNFDFPFAATSPSDFWSRWHVTLTAWVRDYVFRPLGGLRRGARTRGALHLVVATTLIGLWHGAAWGFVLWGLAHGLALALDWWTLRLRSRLRRRLPAAVSAALGGAITALLLFPTAPLFFCPDLNRAWAFWSGLSVWGAPTPAASAAGLLLVPFFVFQIAARRLRLATRWDRLPGPVRGAALAALLYVVLFGAVPDAQRFAYYAF